MKPIRSLALVLLAATVISRADLLVYEPFDYAPHNHETFGRVDGRNGGKGFAEAWKDAAGSGNDGAAYIYDQSANPEALYGGSWGTGFPDWDGKVDNLPTMGSYAGLSGWSSGETMNMTRKLARSAGAMAESSAGVLWLSAVWHMADPGYFTPVGIAFSSNDASFFERAISFNNNGNAIGAGNGNDFRNGMKRLNAMIWENGKDKAHAAVADLDPKKDAVIILKFEFGENDTVKAWFFNEDQELSEQDFNKNAIACSSPVDEKTLDTLAISTGRRRNAIDEIRIATSFKDVISGTIPARQEVKITKQLYDKKSDRYFLTWTSNPGEIYGVYESVDAGGFKPCLSAAVSAETQKKETTFGPFANPHPGKADLKFEIGLPDLTPPVIDRVWGNGTTVSLHFTELMHSGPALDPSNYVVTKDGGSAITVKSVRFHPLNDTVELTTAAPLDFASSFTVTTRKLADRANLPLTKPDVSFRIFDDNPKGVKVFILVGQSNMIGRGHYDKGQGDKIGGVGSLRSLVESDPTNYGHLVDADKKWRKPPNMKFYWNRGDLGQERPALIKGDFTVGFGAGPDCIGPEYGFGMEVEKLTKGQPVLIIKSAWGGKSLYADFCSPSAAARRDGRIGPYYITMMNHVHLLLDNLDKEFPEFAGKGYQIAGFGWHQGWNDLGEPMTSAYEKNMVDFIRDIRREFGSAKLPFSIGTTGHGGAATTVESRPLLCGQLAVADPKKYPEFADNVFTYDARQAWRDVCVSPKEDGCHWNNNGETLYLIGKGMGEGMVNMLSKASSLPASMPWNLASLSQTPEFEWSDGKEVRSLYFKSEPLQGNPTRVFAYYATPGTLAGDPTKDKNLPGIVLVHGGGGRAFEAWARLWASRGFAAIAMDLTGTGADGKRLPDGGPDQSDDTKFRTDAPATDQWTYHAVAAAIRSHSLLRSFPEVDAKRTAITGISWGGYLTCIVAGLDDRFKAAVPVYGCGFLHENSCWFQRLGKMPVDARANWIKLWDPSNYVGSASMPMLFVNGGKDFAYPPDSHAYTYALVKSPKNLHFVPDLPHGHIFDRPSAIEIFIRQCLEGGTPLARIADPEIHANRVTAKVETQTKLIKAQLHYTLDPMPGDGKPRVWISKPADIVEGTIQAERPPEKATIWFLTVEDDRKATVSSRLMMAWARE